MGDKTDRTENLNLSDLNLKKLKLTEEDALALSYLTPGLSKRIQKQLFASLPPSEARKISRTMSMRNENEQESPMQRCSVDRISATLPRKFSYDKRCSSQQNLTYDINQNNSMRNENETNDIKSYLPTKSRDITSPYTDRSSRSESYDSRKSDYEKPRSRYYRASSLREPTDYKTKLHTYSLRSPDSSISEMSSIRDEDSFSENTSLSKFLNRTSKIESNDDTKNHTKPVRRISRFLRPDFYDTPKEESVIVNEKKEREMETQKVLKEIRDKRIKNRISMRKERSLSREKSLENEKGCEYNKIKNLEVTSKVEEKEKSIPPSEKIIKCKELVEALIDKTNAESEKANNIGSRETQNILKNVSENIKNIETNVLLNKENGIQNVELNGNTSKEVINEDVTPNKESSQKEVPVSKEIKRISRLIRPKSYPAENGTKSAETIKTDNKSGTLDKPEKEKSIEAKPKVVKVKKITSPQKTVKEPEKSTKNKFLQSIEKKFEKLRTLTNDDKAKEDKKVDKSNVESAIKRLREQSVPRNVDHITESTLIKRAVSVEDFSNVKSKALQPSRKSVTKILNLFKKYEDKKDEEVVKNGVDTLPHITESNIPTVKSKLPTSRDLKSPEHNLENHQKDRPKSLLLDKVKRYNGSKSDNAFSADIKPKIISKLPRKSTAGIDSRNFTEDSVLNNNINDSDVTDNGITNEVTKRVDRKHLKLDFSNLNEPMQDSNLNRISYTTDESSNLLSPYDETMSCDSWSVCSDFHHTQDLMSPISPNGNVYNSGDESESVIDRIRRKSFYTRFNEKKKQPRKSLVGNYKDLDLYKDYNQKTQHRYKTPADCSSSYKRSSGYSSSGEGDHEYRPYVRAKSLVNDYVNVPNRYQTYNPRRSNFSSLYSSMSEENDDLGFAGTYRKYSYSPNSSKVGNVNRASRSPSSDFQYIPHAHTPMSENSSMSSPSETSRSVTEHMV